VSFAVDPALDIARQVARALEDEAAQPLAEVQHAAPEGCNYFSEFEASISEWSFGYGVAWALARMREPFASSRRVGELASQAVATAWRSFGDEPWARLMAEDRQSEAAAAAPPETSEEPEPEAGSQLGDFMGGLARARSRRPRERGDTPGE
jgi:hypothetical protein